MAACLHTGASPMTRNDALRRAIEWMGRQGRHDPEFLEFTARRFDLSPRDEQLLLDQFSDKAIAAAAVHAPDEGRSSGDAVPPTSRADSLRGYSFLKVFADGRLDAHELAMLERLALEDGVVDTAERQVLSRVFARVSATETPAEVWAEIQQFKQQYGIP